MCKKHCVLNTVSVLLAFCLLLAGALPTTVASAQDPAMDMGLDTGMDMGMDAAVGALDDTLDDADDIIEDSEYVITDDIPLDETPEEDPAPTYPTSGDFSYCVLEDGTVAIMAYLGSDTALAVPETLDGMVVSSIGEMAFYNQTALASITLPATIATIGEAAFYNCEALASVTLQEGLASIGDGAFCWCTALVQLALPSTLSSIGDMAFAYSGLASIVLPDGVQSIGAYAFYDCVSLSEVTLPSNIASIGSKAFGLCSALTQVYYQNTLAAWQAVAASDAFAETVTIVCLMEGDVTGDGVVDLKDAILLMQRLAQGDAFDTVADSIMCDADASSAVDGQDVSWLLAFCM